MAATRITALLRNKRFWAAIAMAATILLSAFGVKNAQVIGGAIQAVIQAIPAGEQPAPALQPSPPAPLPSDGRGVVEDRGEGPDDEIGFAPFIPYVYEDENFMFTGLPNSIEIEATGGAFVTVNGDTIAVPRGATITVEPIRPRPKDPEPWIIDPVADKAQPMAAVPHSAIGNRQSAIPIALPPSSQTVRSDTERSTHDPSFKIAGGVGFMAAPPELFSWSEWS